MRPRRQPKLTSGRANHESRLSSPYLTLHWSRMLNDFRLRAVGEHVPQLRWIHIAVFLDQPRNVVAPEPAAGLALDRQGGRC